MRLALTIHEYPPVGGGAATAASNIAASWSAAGHNVLVVTSSVKGHPANERIDGVEVLRLPSLRKRRLAPKSYELASFCASAWWSLTRRLRSFQPEAILAFFAVPTGFLAVRSARRLGVPVVVSLRGSDVPGFSGTRLGGVYRAVGLPLIRKTLQEADGIVPNSAHLRDLALRFVPEVETKMEVIQNGIEPELIAQRPASSGADELHIVQVGQLIERKRVDLTIRALRALQSNGVAARLTVIGEGPREPMLRSLAGELELGDHVDFTGHLERAEICGRLRAHDVYVMTSMAEGMSNALLEAMASGLPIVTTRNGTHDLVEQAGCGEVVGIGDADGLECALQRFAATPRLRAEAGQSAIDYARQLTWKTTALQFARLLAELRQPRNTTSLEDCRA